METKFSDSLLIINTREKDEKWEYEFLDTCKNSCLWAGEEAIAPQHQRKLDKRGRFFLFVRPKEKAQAIAPSHNKDEARFSGKVRLQC